MDGNVYTSPYHAAHVNYKSTQKRSTATYIGDDLGTADAKYTGAICNEDGTEIYFIPYFTTKILKLDIRTETNSFVGDDFSPK